MINRKLHGRLGLRILSSRAESSSRVKFVFGVKFVSPRTNVTSSIHFIVLILEIYWNSIRKIGAKFSLTSGTFILAQENA